MKWWRKSIIQFFNFYPSEKRGVLILMGTLFVFLIFQKRILKAFTNDSEIQLIDQIEILHPLYYNVNPCINFNDTIFPLDAAGIPLDPIMVKRIITNRQKYGAYNCVPDLLDVHGINTENLSWVYEVSEPTFCECPPININIATAEELSFFFRININKGKTLVKYRNSIGGFLKFEQLKQIYGFPKSKLSDEWKSRIQFGNVRPNRFALRHTSYKALLKHGFINRKSASVLNKLLKKRPLTIEDIVNNVSEINKPLVVYYFKE